MPSVRTRLPGVAPAARWSATSISSRIRRCSWTRSTGSGVDSSRRSRSGAATATLRSATASRNAHVESGTTSDTSARTSSSRDGVERPVERQLLELGDGERALALAVDVALADEAADAPRELLGRARRQADVALVGAALDPGGQLALARRLVLLGRPARLLDGRPRGPAARPTGACRRRPARGTPGHCPGPRSGSPPRAPRARPSSAGAAPGPRRPRRVPPPNSGAVATRIAMSAAFVSAPVDPPAVRGGTRFLLHALAQGRDRGVHRVAVVAAEVRDHRDVGAHAEVSRRARRDQRRRSTSAGSMPAAAQTACSELARTPLGQRRRSSSLHALPPVRRTRLSEPGGYLRRHARTGRPSARGAAPRACRRTRRSAPRATPSGPTPRTRAPRAASPGGRGPPGPAPGSHGPRARPPNLRRAGGGRASGPRPACRRRAGAPPSRPGARSTGWPARLARRARKAATSATAQAWRSNFADGPSERSWRAASRRSGIVMEGIVSRRRGPGGRPPVDDGPRATGDAGDGAPARGGPSRGADRDRDRAQEGPRRAIAASATGPARRRRRCDAARPGLVDGRGRPLPGPPRPSRPGRSGRPARRCARSRSRVDLAGCPYGLPAPADAIATRGRTASTNAWVDAVALPWWATLSRSTCGSPRASERRVDALLDVAHQQEPAAVRPRPGTRSRRC